MAKTCSWRPWDGAGGPGYTEKKQRDKVILSRSHHNLNNLHWVMWYHLNLPLLVMATELLQTALTSYGRCHWGLLYRVSQRLKSSPCHPQLIWFHQPDWIEHHWLDQLNVALVVPCANSTVRLCVQHLSQHSLLFSDSEWSQICWGDFWINGELHNSSSDEFIRADAGYFGRGRPQHCQDCG